MLFVRVSANGAQVVRLLRGLLRVNAALIPRPYFERRPADVSPLGSASARVGVFSGARLEGSSRHFVCLDPCPRVGAAKVRFVRFFLPSASASNDGGQDRNVVCYFLCVNGQVVDAIEAAGDVHLLLLGL